MKAATKEKLRNAQEYCDQNEKSTEFMIQFMMDSAGVDHDCVMKYLTTQGGFREFSLNEYDENCECFSCQMDDFNHSDNCLDGVR